MALCQLSPLQTRFSLEREYRHLSYAFSNLLQIFALIQLKVLIQLFGELYAWSNQFLNVTIISVRTAAQEMPAGKSTIYIYDYKLLHYFGYENVL